MEAVRRSGWRPTPFRDFVLKVHQRCNLACDYCYVYTMADQTWRDRPTVMTPEVWRIAASGIAEHARAHNVSAVRVMLDGGEPLLAGRERLLSIVADLRAALPPSCHADIAVQTNGVLLDEPTLQALHRHAVAVGISLDGTPDDNDRHRRRPDGRGSFVAVDRALTLLRETRYRSSFAGLLCTIDPTTDPIACYEGLLRHAPPAIDFLLPHANWSNPPTNPPGTAPYGDWLVAVFDRWYDAPRRETKVRLFEEIISLLLGGASRSEQVGLSPVGVVVIETDGAIEQVDSLKSTYDGACATGLHVSTDPFDAALTHPGVVARQIGRAALCGECLQCPIHRICGAGHYAHRFRAGAGFRNPSVYCSDLRLLLNHVQLGSRRTWPGNWGAILRVSRHRISNKAFDVLAAGHGDAAIIRELRAAQLSKHLLLLKYIAHAWPGSPAEREPALTVLADAQSRHPDAVAELLSEPLIGAWAASTARRLRGAETCDVSLKVDCGHLGAIAAAGAHRTGLDAQLTAYVRDGRMMVPTLGAARLPLPDGQQLSITISGGALRISGGGLIVDVPGDPQSDGEGWLPLRRLRADADGELLTVALDDLDPYRDNHDIRAASRLSAPRLARWQELFVRAWELLVRHAPPYAHGLQAGLRSLVPLAHPGTGAARSATGRDTFGTFGLTEPESPAGFAVTLVHEFQHSKLSALLDLVPLYDTASRDTYYAPWRPDPRPVGGLLQGVYAFLGVADAWRLLRADPSLRQLAEREFAEVREQVHCALTTLTRSARLTRAGERFAGGMRATLDALLTVPVPDHVVAGARAALGRNRDDWERRNARAA